MIIAWIHYFIKAYEMVIFELYMNSAFISWNAPIRKELSLISYVDTLKYSSNREGGINA